MITLRNIDKRYGDIHPVNAVSLRILRGGIYGIIGKSGAGKSTLLRIMCLLERPDSGEIFFGDEGVDENLSAKRVDSLAGGELLAERRKIGMIFQNFNLFSSRNVFRNVSYPLEIAGWKKGEIKKRVLELLALVGLNEKEKSPISVLSGGQKQRVAIARALANNPKILFCDEATSALDPQTTNSILELIKNLQKQMNLTVVMVTHSMDVVKNACDYVFVLDNGAVSKQGSTGEVMNEE